MLHKRWPQPAPHGRCGSGVERAAGEKDEHLMEAFIAAARGDWGSELAQENSYREGPDDKGRFGFMAGALSPKR